MSFPGDRFDRASIQIVDERDVVLAFAKGFFINANSRHGGVCLSGFAACNRLLKDVSRFIPARPQDSSGTLNDLRRQQDVDGETLEEQCEPTVLLGPRELDLLHTNARDTSHTVAWRGELSDTAWCPDAASVAQKHGHHRQADDRTRGSGTSRRRRAQHERQLDQLRDQD